VRPNRVWHLDFVHRYVYRADTFTLIFIHDHSRSVAGTASTKAPSALPS